MKMTNLLLAGALVLTQATFAVAGASKGAAKKGPSIEAAKRAVGADKTGKLEKAIELGITILDEPQFLALLAQTPY